VSGPVKALEAELSGEVMRQQNKFTVDAGRDVTTDLTSWQRQALGNTEMFAIRQGKRRRHPRLSLANFNKHTFNGENPRFSWDQAMRTADENTKVPEYYKKVKGNDQVVNQYGLIETALKNFNKSRERLSVVNMVGV